MVQFCFSCPFADNTPSIQVKYCLCFIHRRMCTQFGTWHTVGGVNMAFCIWRVSLWHLAHTE